MLASVANLNRRGISLMEILIGIMVLGIGVISLATLFPIGLLQMKRAVNDVRGTVIAQSAWNEVRIRNLLAPPFGPPADYLSRPPGWSSAAIPTSGSGIPLVIDPLGLLHVGGGPSAPDLFGMIDLNGDGTKDFVGGDGIPRVSGGISNLLLALQVFCSPDDLTFDDGERRMIPFQQLGGASYLNPTLGVPFMPGTLLREPRYSWMIVARKVNARQGLGPGVDGYPGVANTDDDGVLGKDDDGEYGYFGSDDLLADYGPDGIQTDIPSLTISLDDPARDMSTGYPVPAPVGPFEVTIVAFYSRDYENRQTTFANTSNPPAVPLKVFTAGSDVATLAPRSDGVQFPDIPLGSYVMDSTFDSVNSTPDLANNKIGKRNGFIYRVVRKSHDVSGNLVLELDQRAKDDGYALTVLRGAVGVFEKQVP